MKVTKIGYSRLFSLGNYENEKISIEAEVSEGEDLMKSYVDLKKTAEHAHEFRNDLREYERASEIIKNPDSYRGVDVKSAQRIVTDFSEKYPNLVSLQASLPAAEMGEDSNGEYDEDTHYHEQRF